MRYCNFWNDNFFVFKFLTILYSYEVSTLSYVSYKLPPCVKKVFDGKTFWAPLKVKNIGKLLEAKLYWSELILSIYHRWNNFFLKSNIQFVVPLIFFDPALPHWPHRCRRITIGWSFKRRAGLTAVGLTNVRWQNKIKRNKKFSDLFERLVNEKNSIGIGQNSKEDSQIGFGIL